MVFALRPYISETRRLLVLAIPVMLAQLAQTGMGVVDTVMAGGYNATDMAAVAVGTSLWLPVILFGQGLLMALTPIIAQLNGVGKRQLVAQQVAQGYWLAGILSLILMLLLWNTSHIIRLMHGIDPLLADKAIRYLHAMCWGVPGYLFFQVARGQCEGLAKTKPAMIMAFIGLLVNIPVNYLFIYGRLGMPELGGVGCGIATASVYWLMFVLMLFYIKHSRAMQDIRNKTVLSKPEPAKLKRIILLGLPIGLAMFFEVTLFAVVSLLVSPLGVTAVAGHQIALNLSTLIYILPMSLGVGVTIRIAFRLGTGDIAAARICTRAGLVAGVCIASVTAIFTVVLREPVILLYNQQPEVVAQASHLILLAAIYQISDSLQVVGTGVLRGYKDTRPVFFITFIAYWLLGLPAGYILGLTDLVVDAMGPAGFWIGFILGLTASAIMVLWRIKFLQRQSETLILQRISY